MLSRAQHILIYNIYNVYKHRKFVMPKMWAHTTRHDHGRCITAAAEQRIGMRRRMPSDNLLCSERAQSTCVITSSPPSRTHRKKKQQNTLLVIRLRHERMHPYHILDNLVSFKAIAFARRRNGGGVRLRKCSAWPHLVFYIWRRLVCVRTCVRLSRCVRPQFAKLYTKLCADHADNTKLLASYGQLIYARQQRRAHACDFIS